MTARLQQGLLLILALAECAPELETMKTGTVRVGSWWRCWFLG